MRFMTFDAIPDALNTLNAMTIASASVCPTGDGGLIQSITDWLVSLMETVGGIGVALAIALESVFPPIPSEVILPLAGFTASRGTLNLVEAIVWATVGSLLGAWALYGISRWVGLHRINRAADKIPGVSRRDVGKANAWFERYGNWSVLIGRVIPVVRSLISVPAGFNRMDFLRFTGWTLLGSAVWNTILVSAGYFLGAGWCSILGYLDMFENVVIAAFIVVIVVWAARKIRTVMRERGERRTGDD